METSDLKDFLDQKVNQYNKADFILNDPISIPKGFRFNQDVEISAFWTSILSWGQRKTIINKCNELFGLMGDSPYDFIINHKEKERKRFENFKHRTFNFTDTLYFLEFLQQFYKENDSLESAFSKSDTVEKALIHFNKIFFDLPDAPKRTQKHIASPAKNSTCKRLNMFLRWMVRNDKKGVDFGIWKQINPSILMMPLDVHVERVARKLNLLKRKQRDWKSVVELTENLKKLNPEDPVIYDYALFGLGVEGEL